MQLLSPAHILREGVKGLWGQEDGEKKTPVHLVVVVGVRVKENATWWKTWRHACSRRSRRVGQYCLQIVTAVMAHNGKRTWRKCMRTPDDSEGITTVQINATVQGEPPFFFTVELCLRWTIARSLPRRYLRSGSYSRDLAVHKKTRFLRRLEINWFIYRSKRRSIYRARMVIYVSPSPENKWSPIPDQSNPRKKIISPNSKYNYVTLFSVGYIYFFILQLMTEDCYCTEYKRYIRQRMQQNQATRCTSFVKRKLKACLDEERNWIILFVIE